MHILVTGGYGFIGSTFVKLAVDAGHKVAIIDKMTYAADFENLDSEVASQCEFRQLDIANSEDLNSFLDVLPAIDCIVNFAAESHVDRSINDGTPFVNSNILGVVNLLEYVKNNKSIKFLQVSTDEVYGSIESGSWDESAPIDPRSPYSASKASAELFCAAYKNTHNLNIVITRCANNFGPRQSAEKLIPTIIRTALRNEPVPVYGKGLNIREWIYVEDHAQAILKIVEANLKLKPIYNIGGQEKVNIDLVKSVLAILGKNSDMIDYVTDRLGHDKRYSVNSHLYESQFGAVNQDTNLKLQETVNWYLSNPEWLERSEKRALA